MTSQGKDRLLVVRGNDRRRREHSVLDNEAAILGRNKLVTLREGNAQLREEKLSVREQKICKAETTQAMSDDHMLMLKHANEQLSINIIKAQTLTEQLQMAKAELESAKSVAEIANLAKSEFLSCMSHDLRTPLNAILGFAQLLETGQPTLTNKQGGRLDQIIKSGWHLQKLINEILDLSAIESGKLPLSLELVSISDVMCECQEMLEVLANRTKILLNFSPVDHRWFIKADRIRVKQVLINLLSNAIKYNREHGSVEVDCTVSKDRIRISIKDSGWGLPPEKLVQLFQPFNRLGQETGNEEGTGIGLVVAKQLVELMGGTIGVESTVGVGSNFWIELVRDITSQLSPRNTNAVELVPQVLENAAIRTLLCVEDNPNNMMLIDQIIEDHPHLRLLSACDATIGIALARTSLPDVILMDINLSGISGIDALKILREDPATAHIPVIAYSANAMPSDIEKALEAGFFRYITKPIKIQEFLNTLDDALNFPKKGESDNNETSQI